MATRKKEDQEFLLTDIEQNVIEQEAKRNTDNFLAAKDFFNRKVPIHLLKRDRQWYNGTILELTNDFFIIDERKLGRRVVFFLELYSIEELEAKNGGL